jgi:hypothetical protein
MLSKPPSVWTQQHPYQHRKPLRLWRLPEIALRCSFVAYVYSASEEFDHTDWLFEPKMDGFRALAHRLRKSLMFVERITRGTPIRRPLLSSNFFGDLSVTIHRHGDKQFVDSVRQPVFSGQAERLMAHMNQRLPIRLTGRAHAAIGKAVAGKI